MYFFDNFAKEIENVYDDSMVKGHFHTGICLFSQTFVQQYEMQNVCTSLNEKFYKHTTFCNFHKTFAKISLNFTISLLPRNFNDKCSSQLNLK